MTRHFRPPDHGDVAPDTILIDAARCWREARDHGQPTQPSLARQLALNDCAMLAPVLDSLIRFFEFALGRPIAVGGHVALSDDERLLLGLVDGSRPPIHIGCPEWAKRVLEHALQSTRIMLAMTLGRPTPTAT